MSEELMIKYKKYHFLTFAKSHIMILLVSQKHGYQQIINGETINEDFQFGYQKPYH